MGESQRHIEPNNIDKGIRFKVNIKAIGKISKVDIMDAIPQTEQNKCVNRSAVREVVE